MHSSRRLAIMATLEHTFQNSSIQLRFMHDGFTIFASPNFHWEESSIKTIFIHNIDLLRLLNERLSVRKGFHSLSFRRAIL